MKGISTITMPKWGMEMVEGEIAEWHASEGDTIAAGGDLLDVETSKIVNTVAAPEGGVLRKILATPGDIVPVGQALAIIASTEVSDEDIEHYLQVQDAGQAGQPSRDQAVESNEPPSAPPQSGSGPTTSQASGPPTVTNSGAVAATPVARRVAREHRVELGALPASGRHGRVTLADVKKALDSAGRPLTKPGSSVPLATRAPRDDSGVPATPVARRLARELGVNLFDCRASGRKGRVGKADVEARAALASRGQPGSAEARGPDSPSVQSRPLSSMRRTIATRLQSAKQEAPHFRVQADARVDALVALREQMNQRFPEAKVSLNDLLIKACGRALSEVPGVNVQFDGETLRELPEADIAVAVALDDGLITPVVRGTSRKGVRDISNEIRDLVTRAKLGTLGAEEIQGGGFTVSNLGMYGIDSFDAIINSPQGAILAVGAAAQRPVVDSGELAVATVLTLTLSSDHRIIDGALAARFLATLRGYLENPATMLG